MAEDKMQLREHVGHSMTRKRGIEEKLVLKESLVHTVTKGQQNAAEQASK